MKNFILTLTTLALSMTLSAQTLEKMQWFNEPENWTIKNNSLTMQVTPQVPDQAPPRPASLGVAEKQCGVVPTPTID